jgi:hypothetical protein
MLMPKRLNSETWEKVEFAGGDFEILLGGMNHRDVYECAMAPTGGDELAHRLRSRVKDWRGVEDAVGNPVPYSYPNLAAMVEAYPSCVGPLTNLVFRTETERKNSQSTPGDGSPPGGPTPTSEPDPSSPCSTG